MSDSNNDKLATKGMEVSKLPPADATSDDGENESTPPLHVQLVRATRNGGGMFVEAYFVFAVGQLTGLWKVLYPNCVKDAQCNQALVTITWIQVACIITAQLTFGIISDVFGRLFGSRLTATLMFLGGILITISFGANPTPGNVEDVGTLTGQFAMLNVALAVFCLGVGGEYPMSSTTAAERSEHEGGLVTLRGRTVAFVFAHQGWGNLAFCIVYLFLLAVTNTFNCTSGMAANTTSPAYQANCGLAGLETVWRVTYALGVIPLAMLFVYRWFFLRETKMFRERREKYDAAQLMSERAQRLANLKVLFTNRTYLVRFIGAAGTWFLWDVAFYGNKLCSFFKSFDRQRSIAIAD